MSITEKIKFQIEKDYMADEYVCLIHQYEKFKLEKPLKGIKILHSTPLFKNALAKLLPIFASEATVTLSLPKNLPFDANTVELLKSLSIPFLTHPGIQEEFDIIMDCAGSSAHMTPKIGAVELTQSGFKYYSNRKFPCFFVDQSKVKMIEDKYGTSDGFVRALTFCGFDDFVNYHFLIFGYGKVGNGLSEKLKELGSKITIVEKQEVIDKATIGKETFSSNDISKVLEKINTVDFVVTATGVPSLIQDHYSVNNFISSKAVLINMGAEDEYGPDFPNSSVLNQKKPLNFLLDEPTRLKFLDPTFALHNQCAALLSQNNYPPGIIIPGPEIEQSILDTFYEGK